MLPQKHKKKISGSLGTKILFDLMKNKKIIKLRDKSVNSHFSDV